MSGTRDLIRLFATDVDDTIVADGGGAGSRFKATWESLAPRRRPLLVYNTGRSVAAIEALVLADRIPAPEFFVGGMGTEVHDPGDVTAAEAFRASVASSWDAGAVRRIVEAVPGVRLQPAEFLTPLKLSWYWQCASPADVSRLKLQFENAGLNVTLAYTSNAFLDVFPRAAGKGPALAWLCERIGVPLETVLVAGASANNASMFALPGVHGILPANAARDLFAAARACKPLVTLQPAVDGVLAGLKQFGALEPADEELGPEVCLAAAR